MFNFMLEEATDTFPMFEPSRMLASLGVLGRGMLTVFAVLCIVWLALVIIRIFLYDIPNRRAAESSKKAEAPQIEVAPVAPAASEDSTLLVAIITAAVAAFRAEEGDSEVGFRVVSFNRTKK